MKLVEKISLEKESRQNNDSYWNRIYLYKEGNFYRSYEISAWYIKTLFCGDGENSDKNLSSSRYVKTDLDYTMVGFPINSLKKFIPAEFCKVIETSEKGDLILEVMSFDFAKYSNFEELYSEFNSWKNSLEIKETQKSTKEVSNSEPKIFSSENKSGLLEIFSRVLTYSLESSSPLDNTEFIRQLKKIAFSLL